MRLLMLAKPIRQLLQADARWGIKKIDAPCLLENNISFLSSRSS